MSHKTEFIRLLSAKSIVSLISTRPNNRAHAANVRANYKDGFIMISALKNGTTHKNVLHDREIDMTITTINEPTQSAIGYCTVVDIIPDDDHEYTSSMPKRQYIEKKRRRLLPRTKAKRVILKASLDEAMVFPEMTISEQKEFADMMELATEALSSGKLQPSDLEDMLHSIENMTDEEIQKMR